MPRKVKRRETIDLTIEKVAFGGKGIARIDDYVIFVENTLPGDQVSARIRKAKKNYAEAYPLEILQPSSLRQSAPCVHFGHCGGCKWQNVDYQQQLEFKKSHVVEALQHIGGIDDVFVHDVLPAPRIFGYRNKMEFSFSDNRWLTPEELSNKDIKKGFALGFHVPRFYDRILDVEYCHLQDEQLNQILEFSKSYFRDSGLPVYNTHTKAGQLRYLVLRKSFATGNVLVNVVTFDEQKRLLDVYAGQLMEKFPFVSGIVNTVNNTYAQIATGQQTHLIAGQSVIQEKLDQFVFDISPESFFQTNSLQAVKLYQTIRDFVRGEDLSIWDLYCGTGSIGIFLSPKVKQVLGFEIVEEAVSNARHNANLNGVENCQFISGDLRFNLADKAPEAMPDCIVCDPPRAGMHKDVLEILCQLPVPQMIYVSCNPATMARDLSVLTDSWRLEEVQPVDMFPHTYHIESVARLTRR